MQKALFLLFEIELSHKQNRARFGKRAIAFILERLLLTKTDRQMIKKSE